MKATIGRILFSLVFVVFGINHFMNANDMSGMVPEWVPGGVFWVYLTGLCLVAAGIAILINKMSSLAGLLLGILLLIFALTLHLPSVMGDGGMASMPNLLKDLGLAGAALFISGHSHEDM